MKMNGCDLLAAVQKDCRIKRPDFIKLLEGMGARCQILYNRFR